MKLSVFFGSLLFTLVSLASDPIQTSDSNRELFSQHDEYSADRLQKWFQDYNSVDDFRTSDSFYLENDKTPRTLVSITSIAFGSEGIYAIGMDGPQNIDGFDSIVKARFANTDYSI